MISWYEYQLLSCEFVSGTFLSKESWRSYDASKPFAGVKHYLRASGAMAIHIDKSCKWLPKSSPNSDKSTPDTPATTSQRPSNVHAYKGWEKKKKETCGWCELVVGDDFQSTQEALAWHDVSPDFNPVLNSTKWYEIWNVMRVWNGRHFGQKTATTTTTAYKITPP